MEIKIEKISNGWIVDCNSEKTYFQYATNVMPFVEKIVEENNVRKEEKWNKKVQAL